MIPYGYRERMSLQGMAIANASNILKVHQLVIKPAFSALADETSRFEAKAEAGCKLASVSADLQKYSRRELAISFCLVIQSVWERQFRSFAYTAGMDAPDSKLVELSQKNDWGELVKEFVRVVPATPDPKTETLKLLKLAADVCRHGHGRSFDDLSKKHPSFWPGRTEESSPTMFGLDIPEGQLEEFMVAIHKFWDDLSAVLAKKSWSGH